MFMEGGVYEPLKGITCHPSDLHSAATIILPWIGVALDGVSLFDVCKTVAYHASHPFAKPITTEDGRQIYRDVTTESDYDRRDVCTTDIHYYDGKVVCSKERVITSVRSA